MSVTFPDEAISQGLSVKAHEPMADFHIQTTAQSFKVSGAVDLIHLQQKRTFILIEFSAELTMYVV